MEAADQVITGEVRIGGQEHFYLETMATIAVPRGEDGDMEIFCSCQSPSEAQVEVSLDLFNNSNYIWIYLQ